MNPEIKWVKSAKKCPMCGGNTVLESETFFKKEIRIRRCENLGGANPLKYCSWQEQVYRNGKSIKK